VKKKKKSFVQYSSGVGLGFVPRYLYLHRVSLGWNRGMWLIADYRVLYAVYGYMVLARELPIHGSTDDLIVLKLARGKRPQKDAGLRFGLRLTLC